MKKLLIILLCLPSIIVGQSLGTGFAINSKGYIATNFHVIDGAESIEIITINKEYLKSYKATIVKVDESNDLAILKVDEDLGKIPFGFKSNEEDVAASIYAYGYPLPEIQGYELKITDGIINSNSGFMGDQRWYQHTASVQPGSSGGPLFNKSGDLVGINNAGINNDFLRKQYGSEAKNVNYAIKSKYLYNLMEDLNISIFVNDGIDRMSLSEQYNKIKGFVYIVSCTITSKTDKVDDIDIANDIEISDNIEISGDYSVIDDPEFDHLYKYWKSNNANLSIMKNNYSTLIYKFNALKSNYNGYKLKVETNKIKDYEARIQSFEQSFDIGFRSRVDKSGIPYNMIMIAIKALEEN